MTLVIIATRAHSQCDTIVIYTVADSSEQFVIIPCNTDSVSTYGEILGNVGSLGNAVALPTDSAAYPFTPLALVENDFNMLSYPIRTNVGLVWTDSLIEQGASCSGTLIASNIVLTAAHCIGAVNSFDDFVWQGGKGLYISPSHANGYPQSQIGKIKVTHIIILKNFYNTTPNIQDDYALLILEENVGNTIGWMGISYHENDSILTAPTVSYNFAYPATSGYDGQDMFYNYGSVGTGFGLTFNNGVVGIPGQSGSCFFYVDGAKHLMYGIYILSTTNYIFTRSRLWEIQQMMDYSTTIASVSTQPTVRVGKLNVFPNPISQISLLSFDIKGKTGNNTFTLELYDLSGRLIMRNTSIRCCRYELKKGTLESGLYTVLVYDETSIIGTTKIVIN